MKKNLLKKMMVIATAGIVLAGCGNNAKTTGTDKLITEEKATEIALEDAGVSKSEAENIRVKLDTDDGVKEYEIEFNTDKQEFDYTIDAITGDILSSDAEVRESAKSLKEAAPSSNVAITEEKAKEIASGKIPGSTVADVQLSLDGDEQRPTYEGTIVYNNVTSEFEIDATTGEILSWDQEM